VDPLLDQPIRRERRVTGALQAYELGDIFEVRTEHEVFAFGDDGNVADSELEQPLASAGVVQYIDDIVIDVFTRKKLFRTQAAASSRLREQNESVGGSIHDVSTVRVGTIRLLPACSERQADVERVI
jgi:hypothetical protein